MLLFNLCLLIQNYDTPLLITEHEVEMKVE